MSRPVRGRVLGHRDGGTVAVKLLNGITIIVINKGFNIGDNVSVAWDFTENKVHEVWKEGEEASRETDGRVPEEQQPEETQDYPEEHLGLAEELM